MERADGKIIFQNNAELCELYLWAFYFFLYRYGYLAVNSVAGIRDMPSAHKVEPQNLTLRFCFYWSPPGSESLLCFQPIYLNFSEIHLWPPNRSWKAETLLGLKDMPPFIWLSLGSNGTELPSCPAPDRAMEMNDIEFCRTSDHYFLVNSFFFFFLYYRFKSKQLFFSCSLHFVVYFS